MEFFDRRMIRALLLFVAALLLVSAGLYLSRRRTMEGLLREIAAEEDPDGRDSVALFPFDPNEADYFELRRLGFSNLQAVQLLKYRAAGKVFRIPEELATLYGMTDSLFRRLYPFVSIGGKYRYPPRTERPRHDFSAASRPKFRSDRATPFRVDTVSAAYLHGLGFSLRWSEAFVDCCRRRGIRSAEELRDIAFIGDSVATLLAPWLIFPERKPDPRDEPVELNTADSAALLRVRGIGPVTARAIVEYRQRLGGFYRVEQLAEVKGVLESNYEKIIGQISCDSFHIRKIDINFAPPERLREHPYLPPRILRKLLNRRQQRKPKGGWSTVEEMVDDDILTEEEAERLRPYLLFGTQRNE